MEDFRNPREVIVLKKRRNTLLRLNFFTLFVIAFSFSSFLMDFYLVESLITFGISFIVFLFIRYQLFKTKLKIYSPEVFTEQGEFKPNKDDLKYIHGSGR